MEDEKVEEGLFAGRMGSPEKGRGTGGEKYVPANCNDIQALFCILGKTFKNKLQWKENKPSNLGEPFLHSHHH